MPDFSWWKSDQKIAWLSSKGISAKPPSVYGLFKNQVPMWFIANDSYLIVESQPWCCQCCKWSRYSGVRCATSGHYFIINVFAYLCLIIFYSCIILILYELLDFYVCNPQFWKIQHKCPEPFSLLVTLFWEHSRLKGNADVLFKPV